VAGRTVRCFACALALGLVAPAALSARVVDPASARLAVSNPAVTSQDSELAALAAAGRATELAARLERIAHDATLNDVSREWLLDRGLHALARIAPTAPARAAVSRLAARQPIVYTRVETEHGRRATPLSDAGATARFVLRAWDRRAARDAAAADLAAGRSAVVDRFAVEAGAAIDGIVEAFRSAPLAQLPAQRAAILNAIAAGRRVDELALVLADRLADPELFAHVVDHADERVALAAIAAAGRALDVRAALAVLTRASRRADIASAAVLAIGRLAANDGAARRLLFDALAEPDLGPSAAAALARLADPAVSAEVGRRLAAAPDESSRRLAVLALRLDGSPAARAELERFAEGGRGSPQLQTEVRRWLER